MTEKVMIGVSLGAEPNEDRYQGQASFGSLRSEVMAKVAFETRDKDLSFEQFHALVETGLRKALVDPDRIDRNVS